LLNKSVSISSNITDNHGFILLLLLMLSGWVPIFISILNYLRYEFY